MIDISLNLYRIFYAVATSKTILEASEKLCISQPAVSKSIKKLEDLLGTQLLYRSKKGIELTNDGKLLFNYVDKCYNYLIAGQKMIEDFKLLQTGQITIGVPSHIACFFALDYIKIFSERYPAVKIRLISASTKTLVNDLYNHKLDFIIDSPPIEIDTDTAIIKPVGELETIFISNNDIPDNELSPENINSYNYILPYTNSSTYRNLKKELDKQNITIDTKIEVDTTDVIIASVKMGLGIGYVVKKAVLEELKNKQVKELKTTFSLPKLKLNVVYMKNYITSASREILKLIIKDVE